ncbi:MAG: hypothetical protein QOD98_4213 [Nocardioidaceae bacterium]|jgi:hypothetical protein|nr:hypothetical protein [Nocardioidaceae bacterium]
MNHLWGAVIAAIGLVATVVFGVQGDLRGRYERVMSTLQSLGTGQEVESRHRLGRYVYRGYPQVTADELDGLVEDFFILASGLQRLRASLTSVRSRWFDGPAQLLAQSSGRMVGFLSRNFDDLVEHLALKDVDDIRADLAAVEAVRAAADRRA